MTNRMPPTSSLVLSLALLALATSGAGEAFAAKSPSFKCRGAVAGAVKGIVKAGLKALDSCHKKRDKSGSPAECNDIDANPAVVGALTRGRSKVNALCQPGDAVLANYPDGSVAGINEQLLPAVVAVIESSGQELQGSPTFTGDKATLKKLRKCHGAIGKGRSATVGEIFKVSSACQKKLDKNAPEFSSIAPQCIASPGGKSAKALGKLGQLCSGIEGASVGSCASLPECVASSATGDGQLLARMTFGGPTQCGNGLKELGEECDDGNTLDGDGCPATCKSGVCGNGVREGDEACDDGAETGNEDACLTSCQAASCGDGFVQEGVEECDDAAPPAGAACAGCQLAAASCGADGLVQATVELEFDPQLNRNGDLAGALRARVDYPDFLEIPGSLDAPDVIASVTDLTGVSLLVNDDDAATAVTANYLDGNGASAPNIAYGSIFRVQFQGCPAGTPLRPQDFPCTLLEVSDEFGFPLLGTTCRVVSLAAAGSPPTTSTTVTSTTSSSSSSVTSTTSATTSTTVTTIITDLCGNGSTVAPETCDDGNTVNTDSCPADCIVDTCQQTANSGGGLTVNIVNNETGQTTFGVATVFIDYPEGKVLIPGSADDSQVQAAVTDEPTTGSPTCLANDRDHGLQFGCLSTSGFNEGLFFRINHTDCGNAGPPALGEFNCQILEASDPNGFPVSATCTLSYVP